MKFNESLKYYRTRARITQSKLAELMSVAQGTVGNWETGTREPDIAGVKKLAKVLGVSVSALLDESDVVPLTIEPNDSLQAINDELESEHPDFINDVLGYIRYRKSVRK